jgi:predicted O-methyltransferase YrrM
MIDIPMYEIEMNIPSEEFVTINNQRAHANLKELAFSYMDQLEGWCSREKASVLIDLVFMIQPKQIVEIGVFGGKSLIPMAAALKHIGEGIVYGVDPWDSIASSQGMEGVNLNWWSSIDHDLIYNGLRKKIKEFGLDHQIQLIRSTSEDCPPIMNIDILHIDGNHSEKTSYIDVTKWVPYVRKGGVIIFDDVNWATTKMATNWLDTNCIRLAEFKGDNIWAVWIKP